MQQTLDLRAGFAAAQASERAPQQPELKGRVKLIHDMLFERFEAAEAQQRFDHFDWARMPKDQFGKIYNWLHQIPRREAPAKHECMLFDGYFTVVLDEDTYRTIRVRTQDAKAKFKPGQMILGYLKGQDNYGDYQSFGHVDERTGRVVIWKKHRDNQVLAEVVRVLEGDVRAAAQAYFKMSRNCVACGTMITNPESIEDAETNGGLGPICKGKARW